MEASRNMPEDMQESIRLTPGRQTLEFVLYRRRRLKGNEWIEHDRPVTPIKTLSGAMERLDKVLSSFADARTAYQWKIVLVHCHEHMVDFPTMQAGESLTDRKPGLPLATKTDE